MVLPTPESLETRTVCAAALEVCDIARCKTTVSKKSGKDHQGLGWVSKDPSTVNDFVNRSRRAHTDAIAGSCTQATTPTTIRKKHRTGLMKSWAIWLQSVLATSILLSYLSGNLPAITVTRSKSSTAASRRLPGWADPLQMLPQAAACLEEMDVSLDRRNPTTISVSTSLACSSSSSSPGPPALSPFL